MLWLKILKIFFENLTPNTSKVILSLCRHRHQRGRPDRGRAWIVLAAAFTNNFIYQGLLKSSGILYRHFPEAMNVSTTEAAVAATVAEAVMRLSGPIAGYLVQRINYRAVVFSGAVLASLGLFCCFFAASFVALILTFGVMFGFGGSLLLIPGDIIVNLYFDQYRAMAMGIDVAGGPLGAAVVAPILEWLIELYGVQGALLVYAAVMLHSCAGAIVFHRGWWFRTKAPQVFLQRIGSAATVVGSLEEETIDDFSVQSSVSQVTPAVLTRSQRSQVSQLIILPMNSLAVVVRRGGAKSRRWLIRVKREHWTFIGEYKFWLLIISNMSRVMSVPMALTVLPSFTLAEVEPNTSENTATLVLSAYNIAGIFGRLGFGWLVDRHIFKLHNGFMTTLLLSGFTAAFFPILTRTWELFVCTVVFAFCIGACSICPAVILRDTLGNDPFPLAYGTMIMFSSLSVFITGPIIGKIYTSSHSYKMCFFAIAASLIAGGLLWLIIPASKVVFKLKGTKERVISATPPPQPTTSS